MASSIETKLTSDQYFIQNGPEYQNRKKKYKASPEGPQKYDINTRFQNSGSHVVVLLTLSGEKLTNFQQLIFMSQVGKTPIFKKLWFIAAFTRTCH